MNQPVECAKCKTLVCRTERPHTGPATCPTKTKTDIVAEAAAEYKKADVGNLGRNIALQGYSGYADLPIGSSPLKTRVEEVIEFAQRMSCKKLGIAFCSGLHNEARLLTDILEKRGFVVASVSCEAGALSVEQVGIGEDEKFAGAAHNNRLAPCSGIVQAKILNGEGTDFNVLMGLCVGQDYLFFKYSDVPGTVLIAKDRVLGHNPVAALHQATAYYHRILRLHEEDK
ncbi:DUF1847 domain-containing protein [Chloroflexota bacterium]